MVSSKPPSRRCAYRLFERACDAGESFGCAMVGRLLVEWPRIPLDPWLGYHHLLASCDKLHGPPCRFLALYLEDGKFGPPDKSRIETLMQRACKGGDEDACGEHATVEDSLVEGPGLELSDWR